MSSSLLPVSNALLECRVCSENYTCSGEHLPMSIEPCDHLMCKTCSETIVQGKNCPLCPFCTQTISGFHLSRLMIELVESQLKNEGSKRQEESQQSRLTLSSMMNNSVCDNCEKVHFFSPPE